MKLTSFAVTLAALGPCGEFRPSFAHAVGLRESGRGCGICAGPQLLGPPWAMPCRPSQWPMLRMPSRGTPGRELRSIFAIFASSVMSEMTLLNPFLERLIGVMERILVLRRTNATRLRRAARIQSRAIVVVGFSWYHLISHRLVGPYGEGVRAARPSARRRREWARCLETNAPSLEVPLAQWSRDSLPEFLLPILPRQESFAILSTY